MAAKNKMYAKIVNLLRILKSDGYQEKSKMVANHDQNIPKQLIWYHIIQHAVEN
jgi:hypothetical protein